MQSRPANQLNGALLEIEIFCQNRFDIGDVGVVVHWTTELHDATEFVTATVFRIGQSKLCVVLGRHGP